MGEPQLRCSSCGENYAAGVIFCPRDGNALSARAADRGADPYLGRTLAGAFRIDALIGSGAVGRVYRAHQLGVERNVALKIMHRDLASNEALLGRFRREARIAGSLSHPNLVSVLLLSDLDQGPDAVPFLVFEYLDGLTLRSALSAQGALPAERAVHVLLQIAEAVGEAHQHGIVHRDLKPENVMLVQRGDDTDFVKVLDFGVAHAEPSDSAAGVTVATHAGAIFGSARYIAPECAAGGSASPRSDVYALATLGYECLTGSTPFDGDNAIAILLKQQNQAVPALRQGAAGRPLPRAIAEVLERNLSKSPAARAADARRFGRDLLAAASDAELDLGRALRTRRGYAIPASAASGARRASGAASGEPQQQPAARPLPSEQPSGGAIGRALVVLACFVLGAGAALGIAIKLGAFTAKRSPSASGSKVSSP